jgi:hypothetical protein
VNLTTLNRVCLAPEAGDAGSSGASSVPSGVPAGSPPASPNPQPAPSPAPRVPYVPPPSDFAPPPAPAGAPGAAPAPAQGAQPPGPQDNPIPYSRVQQMLRQQEQRLRADLMREMQSRGPDLNQRLDVVRQALKMAGIDIPESAPQPVTMEQVNALVEQRTANMERQLAVRSEYDTGVRELASAEQQFADYFAADPGLKARCTALWAQAGDRSMSEIVKEQVAHLDAFLAHHNQRYAQVKRQDGTVVPVRPAMGLGGGARPPQHDLATQDGQDAALDELLGAEG